MTEKRELLPIDPNSVRWGAFKLSVIADGRGDHQGELFIHLHNVANLEDTRALVVEHGNEERVLVPGVAVNIYESNKRRKFAYDHTKLGIWMMFNIPKSWKEIEVEERTQ